VGLVGENDSERRTDGEGLDDDRLKASSYHGLWK